MPAATAQSRAKSCPIPFTGTRAYQIHELRHVRRQEVGRRKIVYGALDIIEKKLKRPSIEAFQEALDNVVPSIEFARAASAVQPIRCRLKCAPSAVRRSASAGW